MNIASMLAPVASTALGTAAQQVHGIVQSGVSFASALRAKASDAGRSPARDADPVGSDQGPEQTELSQQLQWNAIRQNLESLRGSVHDKLRERFAQQGIDLSEPVVLVTDGQGRVLESGRHWDRAKIEELLATDSDLRHEVSLLLRQVAQLHSAAGTDVDLPAASQFRMVVEAKEIFFQVI